MAHALILGVILNLFYDMTFLHFFFSFIIDGLENQGNGMSYTLYLADCFFLM